jgi:chromosome segregation ATPase
MPHIPNFKRIYTNTHSYSFTKSRYSGKTSSASSEVTESYWLNSSVDASQIRDLEKTKARNIEELALHQNSHKIHTEKKEEIKKQIDQIKVALGKLREQKQYVDNMKHKYQLNLTKYQRLEADKINILADAEAKARTVCDQAKKRVKLFADYVASAESLLLLNKDKLQATYNQSKCHSEVRKLDAELRDKLGK